MTLVLFPLSAHLLPGGIMPLRIFEPRYQRMIAEVREREFALCMLDPRQPEAMRTLVPEQDVSYVMESLRLVRRELPAHVPLIGFCGAPWTVATYMVAGQGSREQSEARRLAWTSLHRQANNWACWLWNARSEKVLANAVFRFLLRESLAIGDDRTAQLAKKNVGSGL